YEDSYVLLSYAVAARSARGEIVCVRVEGAAIGQISIGRNVGPTEEGGGDRAGAGLFPNVRDPAWGRRGRGRFWGWNGLVPIAAALAVTAAAEAASAAALAAAEATAATAAATEAAAAGTILARAR